MKKLYLILAILIGVVWITACNIKEPLIEIEAKVSPLSNQETVSIFEIDSIEGLIESKKEDFKVFELNFNMEHTNFVKERKIVINDNWLQVFNAIDGIYRYNNGGGYSQDNESENFARYYQKVIFYAKGLSDDDIRKALKNCKITVSWTDTNKNESFKKEYNISDLIEFSSNN